MLARRRGHVVQRRRAARRAPRRRDEPASRRAPVRRRCSDRGGGLVRLGRDAAPFATVLGPRWRRRLAAGARRARARAPRGRHRRSVPASRCATRRRSTPTSGAACRSSSASSSSSCCSTAATDCSAELRISEGTLTAALVHPREVFAPGDPRSRPPRSSSCTTTRAATRRRRPRTRRSPSGCAGPASCSASACSTTWSSARDASSAWPRRGAGERSERDVVVLGERRGRHVLAAPRSRPPRGASRAAAAQELHALRDDLGDVALVAVLVVVLPGADRALDVDLAALLQVLAARLAPAFPTRRRCATRCAPGAGPPGRSRPRWWRRGSAPRPARCP